MAMTPQAIGELLRRYGPPLVLFARQWTSSPDDCVQDAFLKLVQLRSPPADPAAWLYCVVRNRAIDVARGDRRRKDRESTPPSTGWFIEPEIDGLDADRAVECLGRLPDDVREVIVARIWGGLSFEQIATVAGCSASTAYRRFESGIVTLREILGVPCPNRPN
jgi:RNA polymerase sigma factor (sigma-70 family)